MLSSLLVQFKCPNSPTEHNYGNVHKPVKHTHTHTRKVKEMMRQQQAGWREASPSVPISRVGGSLADIFGSVVCKLRSISTILRGGAFGLKWLDAPMFNLIWGPGPVYLHLSCFQFGFRASTAPTICTSVRAAAVASFCWPAAAPLPASARLCVCSYFGAAALEGKSKTQLIKSGFQRPNAPADAQRAAGGMQREQSPGEGRFGPTLLVLPCVVGGAGALPVTCCYAAPSTLATGGLLPLKQLIPPNSCILDATSPPHLALRPAHTARRPGSQTRARPEVAALSLLLP